MTSFDPYFKWLGIPPDQQPVSHYRLLGIEDFESDADVIETAAERQTLLLRTFQTGPNSELAERLLNEVSEARVCLLDGKSKARYDTQLRATLEPVAEEDPLAFTTEELAAVASGPSTRSRQRSGSRAQKPFWKEPWAIPAAAGGIVVLLLLLMMLSSGGDKSLPTGKQQGTADAQRKPQQENSGKGPQEDASAVTKDPETRSQPNTIAAGTKSLPPSLAKRLVARPPFRDNIEDVILALSFDGDEVVTQEGNMCLKDSSPSGNIVHAKSAAFVSTPTGKGMVFDGFDDIVLVKNFRPQLTQKKEGLTVACLLKITKPGFVLDFGSDGQQLSLVQGTFLFMQSGSYPDTVQNDEMSPKLDQWLTIVGTWDGNKETTYVNGDMYHSRTGRVQGPISDRSFPSGDSTLVIGQQHKGYRRTGRGFGGVLDELLLFKRALSAAEVKALYEFEKP